MRNALALSALAASLALPPTLAAQTGIGFGAKVGTIGVGVEGALGLGTNLAVRGGGALMPVGFDRTYSGLEFELDLPDSYLHIGLDFFPGGGPFRVSGGVLYKPDDPTLEGRFTESQQIGGREYTPQQIGTLIGEIDSGSSAPFLTIGFGRHTSTGIGLFADLGAAFLKEPRLSIRQEGGSLSAAEKAEFDNRLEQERQDIEDELGNWLRIYPILQVGLKLGLGR